MVTKIFKVLSWTALVICVISWVCTMKNPLLGYGVVTFAITGLFVLLPWKDMTEPDDPDELYP